MRKKLNTAEFIERAQKIHNNKYDYSITEYKTAKDFIFYICPEHGKCKQVAKDHLKGRGCRRCGSEKSKKIQRLSREEFIERAFSLYGDSFDYSLVDYVNMKTKVKIICHEHGIFEQRPDDFLKGHTCKFCSREKLSVERKGKKDAWTKAQITNFQKYGVLCATQHPEIKKKLVVKWPDTLQKIRLTSLKKYGTEHPLQSKEIRKKIIETTIKKYKVKNFNQVHLKNTHLLTKEYLIENFLDENRCIKLQEMMDFYNMGESTCYKYMRDNNIRITYKAGGFNPNRPGILYYILDQETGLYKIGVTNKTIEERFPNSDGSKRAMIILEQTYYENGYEALEAEQEILEAFSYCRCTNESWPEAWGGRTEFFKEDILLKDNLKGEKNGSTNKHDNAHA